MTYKLKAYFIYLVLIPVLIWIGIYLIGFALPEDIEKKGLDIPMPEPRAGYEIIFPYTFNTHSTISHYHVATFYYLSEKRQVIYRYDENRYLELQGENCEGLIWYHDKANNIHTRINTPFFTYDKLPKFNYYNPGKDYIAIPANDMSFVMFSLDKGKTFIQAEVTSYAAVAPELVERFIGVDDKPLTSTFTDFSRSNTFTNSITVSGNTGYFILNNGNVLFGETVFYDNGISLIDKKPRNHHEQMFHSLFGIDPSFLLKKDPDMKGKQRFGKYWEIYYQPVYLERIKSARNIKPEPYQGWNKIRCEVGAER
ncbi:T6SS immunity protein Tli3 family protein [Gilliamella sp. ESL0250]|uniref:T6SS immunity protein Tli3 family protein n=1 Tax=Gilliamella sp. ESL0250 TaxID=2705036 RepID=UPI001580EBC5|nr:hypothetical protein [Gilliamella sp. ESL0250]NUF50643.1 hypothetical protein [Gilliamella sp. ESL0250]